MALLNGKRLLVELTPKHVTRKVYYKPLFPDGYAYFARMTARQTLSTFLTCTAVKIVTDDGKYYPVTRDNVYEMFDTVLAGETPDVKDVDPGVHTIASFVGCPTDLTEEVADGVNVCKLTTAYQESMHLYGDVFWMENFTEFNKDEKYQKGYYVVLTWTENEELTDPKISIVQDADSVNNGDLGENTVVWLGTDKEAALRTVIKIIATDTGGNEKEAFLKCKHLRFNHGPSCIPIPEKEKEEEGDNKGEGGSGSSESGGTGQQPGGETPDVPVG